MKSASPLLINNPPAYNLSINKAGGRINMKAVGIDLAGVESRPTGVCKMDGKLLASTCLLYTDDGIIRKTVKYRPDVVAIDAPLALPRGRKSLKEMSNIHLRECDRELIRMRIKLFPLTVGPMRQLTERGIRLRANLERKGLTVIETYPGAAQDILHVPRKRKGIDGLIKGLQMFGVKGLKHGMSGDELDAVTCALVGIMYLRMEHRAIGDPNEILMILPQSAL
jgi:predicted nuclease with RNAse H fold